MKRGDASAKLHEVKTEMRRRRHDPIPAQGRWLGSVVRGHVAYYAVPTNTDSVRSFRTLVARYWLRSLRERSQKHRVTWERMNRLTIRWLPPARLTHPLPDERFRVRTKGKSPVR
jgi:RNA-directed DNA polymerase